MVPAARADDATYLRRVYIDVVGTIPDPKTVESFLADPSPNKREKLVVDLLASPAYATYWTNYWDDVLMGRDAKSPLVDRVAFRAWLRQRFEANTPWDVLVRDLLAATGTNSAGGPRTNLAKALASGTFSEGSSTHDSDESSGADDDAINGAVNWTLRFESNPQDLAGSASRVFLGVQIQCAQCHDHKTEAWKQADFRRFTAAFLHSRIAPVGDKDKAMGMQRRVELLDLPRVAPRFAKEAELAPIVSMKPTALDGTDLDRGVGTRQALAAWMTSKQNPWFAKAIVNRMWGHFLGRGFVDPVDDVRPSNPATMPELWDSLTESFVRSGFDMRSLARTITQTEVYGLAARPGAEGDANNDANNDMWGHFHLVPLGSSELLNAILTATNVERAAERAGIKDMDKLRFQLVRQYAFLFDVDEEQDVPDFSGTVTQALSLLNGQLAGQGSRALPGSALVDILDRPGDDVSKIDALYLRTLSRHPLDDERTRWVDYVQTTYKSAPTIAPPKAGGPGAGPLGRLGKKREDRRYAAYEDVLWTLLNSSEFSFNH